MNKVPILCIDFDGVIHSYISGWKGPRTIPDPPVSGSIEWLRSLLSDPESTCCMAPRYLDYDVQIYSSRSRYWGARRAIRNWLRKQFEYAGYNGDCVELLKFPKEKPPANILIDDRGYRFEGHFPTVHQMKSMLKPWNKKNKNYEQVDLTILVGNIGCGKSTFAKNTVKFNKKKTGIVVVNMDSIQQMVSGGDYGNYDSKKKDIYWAIEEKAICEALERGFSVIIDRTNMDRKRRKRFIDIGKRYWWVTVRCLDWGKGHANDLRRRLDNPRGVAEETWINVFNSMQGSYEEPVKEEGFCFITKPKENIVKSLKECKVKGGLVTKPTLALIGDNPSRQEAVVLVEK